MEHKQELVSVPVSHLVRSPDNVRRHAAARVEELAALIEAQSLLQNLVVAEQVTGKGKARKVRFAVVAGERRRLALRLLIQRGSLPRTHEVFCELVAPERAREVSLAENSGREALHPADEFEAFKALVDDGKGIEDVAARFGVPPLTVRRRLKLAALSPKLLALYRADGGINLDQLMALALSDDHAAQERAWFDAHEWDRTPAALRRVITAGEVEATGNALARFVGIEAYEAAGGLVRRDLFDDAQGRFLCDPALLRRLATERLEALAEWVRAEGWGWVEARVELESGAARQFSDCAYGSREPTREERADLKELARRSDELDRQARAMEASREWDEDEAECIDLEERDIGARRKAIVDGLRVWAPEVQARAGVIVTVNREGDAQVLRGLLREADRRVMAKAHDAARREGAGSGGSDVAVDATGAVAPLARTAESAGATGEADGLGLSDRLLRRLAAHRTVAMQAVLAGNVDVALAALAHALVSRAFSPLVSARSALQITPHVVEHVVRSEADDLPDSAAWRAVEAAKAAWRERLPADAGEWLGWLIALPRDQVLELLALCGSLTLNALPEAGAADSTDTLAQALALDMADWWTPTAGSYLNHVPKARIVEALREAEPDGSGEGLADMKKDALVTLAEERLAGKRWLPAPLR